ncbi:hypothetical protein VTI74DRAFT_5494 [Chaetomium olivicolor]
MPGRLQELAKSSPHVTQHPSSRHRERTPSPAAGHRYKSSFIPAAASSVDSRRHQLIVPPSPCVGRSSGQDSDHQMHVSPSATVIPPTGPGRPGAEQLMGGSSAGRMGYTQHHTTSKHTNLGYAERPSTPGISPPTHHHDVFLDGMLWVALDPSISLDR